METFDPVQQFRDRCPDILQQFDAVLAQYGMDFEINSIEFVHAPTLTITTSGCPPPTRPVRTCIIKPGGRVHCFTECK